MGKYDAILKGLPKFPSELSEGWASRQREIDEAKAKITDRTPSTLLALYAALRSEVDRLESEKKEMGIQLEAASSLLLGAYEGEGITSLRVAGIGSVRTEPGPYAHITDKPKFHQWCLENGFGLQMQLPWQTMNNVAKERLLANQEPPEGVTVYLKDKLVLTRDR